MKKEVYKKTQQVREKYWWFLGRKKVIDSVLKKYLNQKKLKILDVGCGSATAFSVLSRFGFLFGVDKSDIAIRFCRKLNYVSLKKGDVVDLPFSKANFDLVAALDLLEHIQDDRKALKEFNRVLKNRGYLIVTVPAMPFLWGENDIAIYHFRRYQKKELKRKIESAGFEIKKLSYFNFFLFPFYLVWHFKKRFEWIIMKSHRAESTLVVRIPFLVNKFFTLLFSGESLFLPKINFPWGSSLICFAQKKECL